LKIVKRLPKWVPYASIAVMKTFYAHCSTTIKVNTLLVPSREVHKNNCLIEKESHLANDTFYLLGVYHNDDETPVTKMTAVLFAIKLEITIIGFI